MTMTGLELGSHLRQQVFGKVENHPGLLVTQLAVQSTVGQAFHLVLADIADEFKQLPLPVPLGDQVQRISSPCFYELLVGRS